MSQDQNQPTLPYSEVCRIIGHLILNSRSELVSMEGNVSNLLQQLQTKNQEIQELRQALSNGIQPEQ